MRGGLKHLMERHSRVAQKHSGQAFAHNMKPYVAVGISVKRRGREQEYSSMLPDGDAVVEVIKAELDPPARIGDGVTIDGDEFKVRELAEVPGDVNQQLICEVA